MLQSIVRAVAFASLFLLLGSNIATPAYAKTILGPPTLNIYPVARVVGQVNNSQRTVITGQTLSFLHNATDLGTTGLPSDTAMDHMIMVLQASPQQDYALKALIDQQLDQGHPNFHHWMTPDEFGTQLGVADSDITQVTDWLESQGFTIDQVMPGKRFIQFSGTVGQVDTAFQTQMHQYNVAGVTHIANSTNISVPTALRPVIAGVATLHDFFKTGDMKGARKVSLPVDPLTGKLSQMDPSSTPFSVPDYTSGTTHYVGAADFAAIYNTTPLLQAGNDGTGISIGIIGRTDIHLSDVQVYREFFGLKNNDPTFTIAGEDPGVVAGDDGESYLDVEVSGGAAPGASINFITSRATLATDGVDLSAMYAVQNNLTDIISESYGECEYFYTAVQAQFYNDLWAQAAAQGQSVFVSSGDNGPASCDDSNDSYETYGYAVSMLASTPYNVAVGGTIFAEGSGTYWNTTGTASPPFLSALGYIPEKPWNEAKGSGATGASGLWSGSGGISAYFETPAWQHGFGVPASDPAYPNVPTSSPASPFVPGPHRYLPDVALAAAADHDGTLFCAEGVCQLSSSSPPTIVDAGIVGGTSVAAPSMAGVQALIDQYNGGRQGLPNYIYYALADAQHTAGVNCSAEAPASNCAFQDVDTGNTLICGNSTCTAADKIGWTAAAGYDLATGLGSPNATNLAQLWSSVTFRSTVTTLNLSQTTGITHGQPVTASGSVAPGSGTGVPTGQVAFIASSGGLTDPIDPDTGGYVNPVSLATLDGNGNYSISLANLPAGTYYLTARYGGDGTFASSLSAPIQVTVTQEGSSITIQPNAFNGTTCEETPSTSFNYGDYVWTDVTVAGGSGQGVPTGTVSITEDGNPLATTTLNASGVAHFLSGAIPTTSCVYGYSFQDTAPLIGGTHVLGATYSGDASFGSMTATPVTVTIGQATLTGKLTSGSTYIASGDPVQLTMTLTGLSGAGPGTLSPTGTVTFTDTTTSTTLGTATLSPTSTFGGVAVLTTTSISGATGAHAIQAATSGDGNYSSVTSATVNVTVQSGTATSVAVTASANPTAVGSRPTFTATMTPTTVTSGTVSFYDSGVLLGTGTVSSSTHAATYRPAASVSLVAGTHNITAIYGGTTTYNASPASPALAEVFTQAPETIQLTVLSSGMLGQTFAMSGALGLSGTAVPPATGSILFFDGGNQIGSGPITIVTAAAGGYGIFQGQIVQALSAGVHTITAQLSDPNYTTPVSNAQTITVIGPPTISNAFSGPTVPLNGTTTLTFTITNPNATASLSGVAFSDTLPAALAVAATPNVNNTCNGTVTATAAANQIALSGGSIASGSSCTLSVDLTPSVLGTASNTTGPVSSNEGGVGTVSNTASINVLGASLSVTVDDGQQYARYGETLTYTVTISNGGPADANDIGISETFSPDVDPTSISWTCSGGSNGQSCTASGTGPLSDSNVVVPSGQSLTYTVTANVLSNAPDGSVDNTVNVTTQEDLNAPYSAIDSDILVIFRDGFEGANPNGTESAKPVVGVTRH